MATDYDEIDVRFGWNGDFILEDGDIKLSQDNTIDSLKDQLHSIVASVFNDWELYPTRAAGLDDFIGEPNTQTTATEIHDRLRISITSAGLVAENDLRIRVIPVHMHRVMIILQVDATPTVFNKLTDDALTVSFVFDSVEQTVFTVDQRPDYFD